MTYRELHPHRALSPYVDRFWLRCAGLDGDTPSGEPPGAGARAPTRILPDGCIDVLVDVFTGAARAVGTMTRAVLYAAPPGECLAAVRFKPGAAFAFLCTPALELTDRVVPAAELGLGWLDGRPRRPADVRQTLAELELRLLERVGAVERDHVRRLDPRLCQATRRLLGERAPSVDALARELGLSRQHLGRVFQQRVGVSPKTFASVARLQRAVDLLGRAEGAGLAEAALALGYYDQAHMCRDFRELCALSPREVRAARGSIFPIRSLWLEA